MKRNDATAFIARLLRDAAFQQELYGKHLSLEEIVRWAVIRGFFFSEEELRSALEEHGERLARENGTLSDDDLDGIVGGSSAVLEWLGRLAAM